MQPGSVATPAGEPIAEPAAEPAAQDWLTPTRLQTLAALLALILAGLGWLVWRRRVSSAMPAGVPAASALAAGVHQAISSKGSSAAPPEPRRFDLRVDIVSAQRSLMALMIEYRVTIANRSDRALRDMAIGGLLEAATGARRSDLPHDVPLQLVERIGPHQTRSVAGEAKIPLSDVTPMRQGNVPVMVPVLHLSLSFADGEEQTRSFALGLPSAVSQARLQPIALNTPPGGIPGLSALELREGSR